MTEPTAETLTEASVAFLLEHRRYPGCTMASLTIRERLVAIEAAARASQQQDDAEAVARLIDMANRKVQEAEARASQPERVWRVLPDEDGEGGQTWEAAFIDCDMARASQPLTLDVERLRCGNCGDELLPSEVRGHLLVEGREMDDKP